jgi:hypothetical protein
VDHTKTKAVLASRLRAAYDDLFKSDKEAHAKSATDLKGWFKTKTGSSDAVAEKMATTFKSLASYGDFTAAPVSPPVEQQQESKLPPKPLELPGGAPPLAESKFGLTYRIEIHLPDTTNIDTFRSIFRALREELF